MKDEGEQYLVVDSKSIQRNTDTLILIVDDEESICRTLKGIFEDEGYRVLTATSGEEALTIVRSEVPSIVFLDIWMPGKDGLDTLAEIKSLHAELPVVMISGHATIATAMKATRLGASDFIEKPLDLDQTLAALSRALGARKPVSNTESSREGQIWREEVESRVGDHLPGSLTRLVFESVSLKGRAVPQKTLAKSVVVYGHGVHTGQKSGLILEPLPPSSGIHYTGMSEGKPVPAHVNYVESTGFATTLKLGETQIATIEHLMSALHAYGVTNLLVKCNGEIPVLDGSSLQFCKLIEDVGLREQEGEWHAITVKEPVTVGDGNETITLEPHDSFVIDYTLQYPAPLGHQNFVFKVGDIEAYKREIAPARTFGFLKDIDALQKMGLAQGGRFDNFVLYAEEGAINVDLRFPDEAVRHKILDAIGDLYLLGRPIQGKLTARMTGHSDNIHLLQAIYTIMRKEAGLK